MFLKKSIFFKVVVKTANTISTTRASRTRVRAPSTATKMFACSVQYACFSKIAEGVLGKLAQIDSLQSDKSCRVTLMSHTNESQVRSHHPQSRLHFANCLLHVV